MLEFVNDMQESIAKVRVGPGNYCLKQPGKRISNQTYHIHLLKHWLEPAPAHSASGQPMLKLIQKGEKLTFAQWQDLAELDMQFRNVFFKKPDSCHPT